MRPSYEQLKMEQFLRDRNTLIWRTKDGKEIPLSAYGVVGGICWAQCIPYEGNEHLLGKTDDCDEYYKTWEE